MKNSDIYVFIPVTNIKGKVNVTELKEILNLPEDKEIEQYIEKMTETIELECKKDDYKDIERVSLGQIKFYYYADDCLIDNNPNNKYIPCSLVLTWHNNSELGILQIIFKKCQDIDAQIGGIIFSNNIKFNIDSGNQGLSKNPDQDLAVFLNRLNLQECGNKKIVNCNDRNYINDDSIYYLLAGESTIRIDAPYEISTYSKGTLKKNNYAKFDFYDLYASELSVVYLYDNYSNEYNNPITLKREILLIYICEIAVFQNAAISRINKKITEELQENGDIHLSDLKRIQKRYGRTIVFWDNNIFNYTLSQELSNDIATVFGNKKLYDEYKKNDAHLQRIMDIKDSINSKVEGMVLNALTIILGTKELFDIVVNFNDIISGHANTVRIFGSSIVLLCLLTILLKRRNDRV